MSSPFRLVSISPATGRRQGRPVPRRMSMKPYGTNAQSRFRVGQKIRFRRSDGVIAEGTVRLCFWQPVLSEPFGPDQVIPALVLSVHSWCPESAVIDEAATTA